MSPINHTELQVDGDTTDSGKRIKGGESLRVPIVYQFRWTDVNGYIFGDSTLKKTSTSVKNAKFANIIGIDIWTDRNAIKPKQYDIIVYSTYGSTVDTNTSRTKTSSQQTLINAVGNVANKLEQLSKDNKTLSTKTSSINKLIKGTSLKTLSLK